MVIGIHVGVHSGGVGLDGTGYLAGFRMEGPDDLHSVTLVGLVRNMAAKGLSVTLVLDCCFSRTLPAYVVLRTPACGMSTILAVGYTQQRKTVVHVFTCSRGSRSGFGEQTIIISENKETANLGRR